ncbi:AEC family transporter [Deinococcus aquiradiocola]|uniref:AEC family transporter n=1 Tax=Deinococcus aquiradiocola TaxID=393059 RepID=UPI001E4F5A2F|nr:AEC family transporter [Deinococcus aquiradiocola]
MPPLLSALLDVIVPVALVALVGFVLGRRLTLDQNTVARLSLYALTPALAFDTILNAHVAAREAVTLGAAFLLTWAVTVTVSGAVAGRWSPATRRSVMASSTIWNSGNLGLPIALFAFGQAGLERALVVFLVGVIGTYVLGPAIYSSGGGWRGSVNAVLRLPVLWAALAALLWRVSGVPVPLGVARGVHLMSQATLPLVLLSLGLQLGAAGRIRVTPPMLFASGVRLLVGPLAALGISVLLGLRGQPLAVLVLSASMPTAVNALLLAREYGGDADTVAGVVLLTTLGALLTVTATVTLLPHLP